MYIKPRNNTFLLGQTSGNGTTPNFLCYIVQYLTDFPRQLWLYPCKVCHWEYHCVNGDLPQEKQMNQFFAKDYTGGEFHLFDTVHIITLFIILLFNLSFIYLRKNPNPDFQKKLRYSMAAILLINELSWHLWNAFTGQWTFQTMLPLHLCSVFVFLNAYMLISKNYQIFELSYFLGIGGAIQNLFTPDMGIYGFPHYRFFQGFISHGLIVSSAVFMAVVIRYRPYWKSMLKTAILGNIYMVFVFIVNSLIGSNYLFINHKPETASLMDILPDWPVYIIYLEGIAFITFIILYLPYRISDLRQKRVQPSTG